MQIQKHACHARATTILTTAPAKHVPPVQSRVPTEAPVNAPPDTLCKKAHVKDVRTAWELMTPARDVKHALQTCSVKTTAFVGVALRDKHRMTLKPAA